MHVHVSLLDKKGRNIFQGKDPTGSPELRYAVQGLRLNLSESMLICAHHASSYHRFEIFPMHQSILPGFTTTGLSPYELPQTTFQICG